MNLRKVFMLMLVSIFSLCAFNNGYAQEREEEANEPAFEKIYVSPDQILLFPEGIFYLNEFGDIIPVRLISSDASGLYVLKAVRPQCRECGFFLDRGVCKNNRCSKYGR